jgi:hypothetical protein
VRFPFRFLRWIKATQTLKYSWKTVDLVQDYEPIFIIGKVEFWVRQLGTI